MCVSVCGNFNNMFSMNLATRHQSKKDRAFLFELTAYNNLLINHLDKISYLESKKPSKFMLELKRKVEDLKKDLEIMLELSYQENIKNTTIQELSNKIETIVRKTI